MMEALPYDETTFGVATAGFVLLLPVLLVTAFKQRTSHRQLFGARDHRWLLAATLAGLLLRALWPDAAIFHENGHGYRTVGMGIDPSSDLHVYGSGYQAFLHLLFQAFPGTTTVALISNVLVGSATVYVGGLIGGRLFGSRAGVYGAWALAVLPIHIRLSATESPFVLAIFLSALALWAIFELRAAPSIWLALLAGIAAGLAPQFRPLLIGVPWVVLGCGALIEPGALRWLKRGTTLLFVAIALGLLTFHVSWLLELHGEGGRLEGYGQFLEIGPHRVLSTLTRRGLLLDPAYTPVHFVALACLGVAASWHHARRAALLLAIGFLGLTWVYGARANHYSEALRFAAAPQVFMALLAGPALVFTTNAVKAWGGKRAWLSGLPAACLVGAALFSHAAISTATADDLEYAFLQASFEDLPEGCAMITPAARMGRGRIETSFPFYEFRERFPGNDHSSWGLARSDQPMWEGLRDHNPCVLYTRGLACASFLPEESPSGPYRKECVAFEDQFELEELHALAISGHTLPTHLHRHPRTDFQLKMFRVVRKRP